MTLVRYHNERYEIVIHVKILDEVTYSPVSDARVTLIEIEKSIFWIEQQQEHLKDINYTNLKGLTSFILDSKKEYVLRIRDPETNKLSYIEVEKNIENHSIIIGKF